MALQCYRLDPESESHEGGKIEEDLTGTYLGKEE